MPKFNEIILTSGDIEIMLHIANKTKEVLRIYAYTSDIEYLSELFPQWKFEPSINKLFTYIITDDLNKAKRALHAHGFVT